MHLFSVVFRAESPRGLLLVPPPPPPAIAPVNSICCPLIAAENVPALDYYDLFVPTQRRRYSCEAVRAACTPVGVLFILL